MLRYIHEEQLPYRVTLIYSNRDRASTAFLDELRELEQALPDFRLILTMTQDPGWEGETRKVDARASSRTTSTTTSTGTRSWSPARRRWPRACNGALREAGVRDENVIAERYSGY